ncbi:response regulator, partial [uncultured Abyssibacter sp.]|uniref:ATP-binding response regulator n=1 Tax=uncultured Abyssibacter sp. TaxID=2320202 RepID=UPI0032B133A2
MNPTNTTPGDSSDHPAGGPLPAVLVVDDIEANLVAMKRVLKDLDISISTAQSGPDALALVIRQEFAVVLLDVRMPGMDGYETAEAIFLANPAAPPPIIFVTADDRSEERMLQGYESGAIDFLYKPIQERLLRSKVRILTDLHRQRQELKLMTLALSEANRRATSLLEAASEGIVGVDPDGVITFANPAAGALLKTQADHLKGMPMQAFIAASELIPEGRPWVETPLAEAVVLEGSARDRNTTLRGADNRPFPVEMGATTISDAGHVSEFVLAFHDISD